MTMLLAPISSRNQFGELLNSMGLTGLGVEVGTHRGEFAALLLASWRCRQLVCVDPWSVPPGYEQQAEHLRALGGATRQEDMDAACAALAEHHLRAFMVRATSDAWSRAVLPESVDFVYIDGDHRLAQQDVELWWPKVKRGGVLAGHDFLCPGEAEGGWGATVQPAAFSLGLDVHVVAEEDGLPWSFYVRKP